jgi:hypothetical protein
MNDDPQASADVNPEAVEMSAGRIQILVHQGLEREDCYSLCNCSSECVCQDE